MLNVTLSAGVGASFSKGVRAGTDDSESGIDISDLDSLGLRCICSWIRGRHATLVLAEY